VIKHSDFLGYPFRKTFRLMFLVGLLFMACQSKDQSTKDHSPFASDILGNSKYKAISYGGYRANTRNTQPTIDQITEDLIILEALGFKLIRTYNVHFEFAKNALEAIRLLKMKRIDFEMYVMLGAWINCKNAWTDQPNHDKEDFKGNALEISQAVELTQAYPDIVKIISVGNEARVRWATSYFVQPKVILNWVNHLQQLKADQKLPKNLWITSSDDFSSWGGGDPSYHEPDLEKLVHAVDYISIHTYPFHNTHYNPKFWISKIKSESQSSDLQIIDSAMFRAKNFAVMQYNNVKNYVKSLGVEKPIHIGETGWATQSSGFYGNQGSRAADEYKQALYFKLMSDWAKQNKTTCVYFEAFDEQWKNPIDPQHSENHFGLFTIEGKAKFSLWNFLDQGALEGLGRGNTPIEKTFQGNKEQLLSTLLTPPKK
jgi:exo-beta-1,3-glucanase (GH17 family)